jgi:hypothetical protein
VYWSGNSWTNRFQLVIHYRMDICGVDWLLSRCKLCSRYVHSEWCNNLQSRWSRCCTGTIFKVFAHLSWSLCFMTLSFWWIIYTIAEVRENSIDMESSNEYTSSPCQPLIIALIISSKVTDSVFVSRLKIRIRSRLRKNVPVSILRNRTKSSTVRCPLR